MSKSLFKKSALRGRWGNPLLRKFRKRKIVSVVEAPKNSLLLYNKAKFKLLLKKVDKDLKFKVLRILSLLPIGFWPLIFFMSIFFFDDPNANLLMVWGLFFGVNSYPLFLIVNVALSNKLYVRKKMMAYGLLWWPIILFSYLAFEVGWN